MTRATLSNMLHHLGALTDAEVTELEKLAENFPYCQAAHTLLAKALHDRGSMLAGQKLRRAATYAADRRVLRRLLMAPPVETPPAVALPPAPALKEQAALAVDAGGALAVDAGGALVETPEPATPPPPETAASAALPLAAEAPAPIPVGREDPPAAVGAEAPKDDVAPANAATAELEAEPVADQPAAVPAIADFDLVPGTGPNLEELPLFETADEPDRSNYPTLGVLVDDLPAALLASVAPIIPSLEPDPAVSYYIGSSRLGAELVATAEWPAGEGELLALWLASAPSDARWTQHAAAHEPPRPAQPKRPFEHQFALIDRFLREKPRLRTMDPTQPLPEKVPDLAQRSAHNSGALVSESMARILARQGKTARAIAMYEQLQVKFPEKAAIFAAQIAALRATEA